MASSGPILPRDGELAALLAAPAPRPLPPALRRVALQNSAPLSFGIFGALFGGFGLVFVWLFFPWNFQRDLDLKGHPTVPSTGWIISTADTRMRINKTPVVRYVFEFRVADGEKLYGECYTTGKRWTPGEPVPVIYSRDQPTLACPVDARLSRSSLGMMFVVIFPIAGAILTAWVALTRRRALRLYRDGEVAQALITDIEHTQTMTDDYPIFKITLQREGAPPGTPPVIVRKWKPKVVSFLQQRMAAGQPVCLLYDPSNRSRFVLPETP